MQTGRFSCVAGAGAVTGAMRGTSAPGETRSAVGSDGVAFLTAFVGATGRNRSRSGLLEVRSCSASCRPHAVETSTICALSMTVAFLISPDRSTLASPSRDWSKSSVASDVRTTAPRTADRANRVRLLLDDDGVGLCHREAVGRRKVDDEAALLLRRMCDGREPPEVEEELPTGIADGSQ